MSVANFLANMVKPPTEGEREAYNDNMAWQAFCDNHHYSVIVRHYMCDQYRIQLCDIRVPDPWSPPMHGGLVQELCTYHEKRALAVTDLLCMVREPLEMARCFATPDNCEYDGGRIRLDNGPLGHPLGFRNEDNP